MIEPAAAAGEAFNIGPATPHVERDLVEHLGRRLGLEVVEVRHASARPSWHVSSAKATRLLGYIPTIDAFAMVDAATGVRR
jgi:nucleoside-diphosphate-sugar epimerase